MPPLPVAGRHPYATTTAVVGSAYGIASMAVALGPAALTSYAGRDPLVAALAGLALLGASVVAALGGQGRRIWTVAAVATVVWFAPVWVGWSDGPPVVRGIASLVEPFLLASAVHLVAGCAGWLGSRPGKAMVDVCYLAALASSVTYALFRDPLVDPTCWNNCVTNVFMLRSEPQVVQAADLAERWFAAGAGALLILVSLARARFATAPARRAVAPVLCGGALVGAAALAHAVRRFQTVEAPADMGFRWIYLALATGLILAAAGPVLAVFRERTQRRSIARIAADLEARTEPGALQDALARAVGDPELTIEYWVPSVGFFVDSSGHPVGERQRQGGSSTTLAREGAPLARIWHQPSVADAVRAFGAGTQLAVDNERLRASLLIQALGIRASRERIIETGDAARRDAERDLHDGAQQQLLALSYHLRLARGAAEQCGEADTAALVSDALAQTLAVLAELRDLAHGIYPVELVQDGLGPALEWLANQASIPVAIVNRVDRSLPLQVATAAYVVVKEAIDDAASRSATAVDVSVDGGEDRIMVAVLDDGAPSVPCAKHATDRVGALGGTVRIATGSVEAEIPCA